MGVLWVALLLGKKGWVFVDILYGKYAYSLLGKIIDY